MPGAPALKPVGASRSYWVAVLSVFLIAAAEDAVHAPIDDKSRFLVLLIPVAACAWLGGIGPGFTALVLSCLVGAFLYLPPKYSILISSPSDVISLGLYFFVALVLIGIIESLRRSRQALTASEATVTELNVELSKSLARQVDANRRQKQFTSDASHELKTPLTAIRVRTGIALSNPADPEELVDHIVAINRAAGIMTGVVQDLLLLAASDEGQLRLVKEPTLVQVLTEVALASVDTAKHNLTVCVDPDIEMNCDPSAVTRVLVNLLQNAVAYTPEGRSIWIGCTKSTEMVTITVTDQGKGIPADQLGLIFDRFHRVNASRGRESGGSGLGLAIARAIVEAHGGTIVLESTYGEGTTLKIDMPR